MEIEHVYIEKGQGEPIIFLHGNGENSSYFKAQIEAFSERYHVFAVDTRGHGRTPRGNKPFTIQQFADDLVCFMNMHQIQKAHLLGFSDGGIHNFFSQLETKTPFFVSNDTTVFGFC